MSVSVTIGEFPVEFRFPGGWSVVIEQGRDQYGDLMPGGWCVTWWSVGFPAEYREFDSVAECLRFVADLITVD